MGKAVKCPTHEVSCLFATFEAPGLSNKLPKAETSRAGP